MSEFDLFITTRADVARELERVQRLLVRLGSIDLDGCRPLDLLMLGESAAALADACERTLRPRPAEDL